MNITMNNVWKLCKLELPEKDGIYEVRLNRVDSIIDPSIETIMEFKNGEWLLRVPMFINEYYVNSWRYKL